MSTVWGELEAVLREQVLVLQDLISVGQKKAGILVEGKAQDLEALVNGEQVLAWRLGRLEERRQRLLEQLAAATGQPPETISLKELQDWVPAEHRSGFAEIAAALSAAAEALRELNDRNRSLLQGALAYTEFAMQLMRPGSARTPTYGPRGQSAGKEKGPRLVDGKA